MEASDTESPVILQLSPKGTKFLLANSDQKNGRVRCEIKKENHSTSMETTQETVQ